MNGGNIRTLRELWSSVEHKDIAGLSPVARTWQVLLDPRQGSGSGGAPFPRVLFEIASGTSLFSAVTGR